MGLSSGKRRGFFFSGAAAVLLIILTASVMLWISAQNSRSARAQLLTEGQAMLAFRHSFSDGSYEDGPLRRVSEVALDQTVKHAKGGAYSGINTGTDRLRDHFCNQLALPDGHLRAWAKEVETLGKQVGLTVHIEFPYDDDKNDLGNCNIEMATYKTVKVTFPATYTITDSTGTKMSGKMAGVLLDLDINGYEDAYTYLKTGGSVTRQIFFKDSVATDAGSVAPTPIADAVRGKSWAYGKTTTPLPAAGSYCALNKEKCIVVIDHTTPTDIANTAGYAGVILRKEPTVVADGTAICNGNPVNAFKDTGDCLDCLRYVGDGDMSCAGLGVQGNQISIPFVAVSSFDKIGDYVLIDSKGAENSAVSTGYHRIWDIEKLRAMSVCGFYVSNPNDAPDFLQRMTTAPGSSLYGIEGFAIGVDWADNGATGYSNVDHVFFGSGPKDGVRVKGMPGCRNVQQCSPDTPEGVASPFGHFALDNTGSSPHSGDYGATSILCTADGAPCD